MATIAVDKDLMALRECESGSFRGLVPVLQRQYIMHFRSRAVAPGPTRVAGEASHRGPN